MFLIFQQGTFLEKLLDNDNLANELKEIMSAGNLVSDDILNSIVSLRLKQEKIMFLF